MHHEDSYFKALFLRYAIPALKEALSQYFAENPSALKFSQSTNNDDWISTSDASKMLGKIDRHTLYNYIKLGLPAKKIGKSYKFKKSEIEKFLNNKK